VVCSCRTKTLSSAYFVSHSRLSELSVGDRRCAALRWASDRCRANSGIRAGSIFGSQDVREGKGTLKVCDARDVMGAVRVLSDEEGSRRRTTRHKRVVEKASTGMANYPMLTKMNYNQWALLMKIKLEARGMWSAVRVMSSSKWTGWCWM
jgi:hypothetical protein